MTINDNPEENMEDFDQADLNVEPPKFEELVTTLPERSVDDDGGNGFMPTASEADEETTGKTDLQSILKALTPRYKDTQLNEMLQPVMVARVFPDNMLDSCKMTALSRLFDQNPEDPDIDVWGIILATHNAHSIGYEGRGIIDRLEIAGVAHDEEMENISKQLGL